MASILQKSYLGLLGFNIGDNNWEFRTNNTESTEHIFFDCVHFSFISCVTGYHARISQSVVQGTT